MKMCRLASLVCLLAALSAAPSRAEPITELVVFGDSLSDRGNASALTGGAFPPAAFGYSQGRFTNSALWVERLAVRLGVATPTASLNGGLDYAYGGATTNQSGNDPLVAPDGTFITNVPSMGAQIASYLQHHAPKPGTLVTLWGGANDFLDGQTDPTIPAAHLTGEIQQLIAAGGKNFLVANLPPLGETPLGLSLTPQQRAGLDQLAAGFNAVLAGELQFLRNSHPGVTITLLDANALFKQVLADPTHFGFTNTTGEAILHPNQNPNDFLFWDGVHPTGAGHQIIGDAAFAAVTPEPSSLLLLATAGFGCGGYGWLRRRRAA